MEVILISRVNHKSTARYCKFLMSPAHSGDCGID